MVSGVGILATIFLALIIAGASILAFNKIGVYTRNRNRQNQILDYEENAPVNQVNRGETRWGLVALALIPGFFLGAVMAGFYEGLGLIENSEAFSPSFYVFVSIGSIISYFALDRIFKRKV